MGKKDFRNFFNGYIVVNVEGLNPEKFINMSAKNSIKLWDIKRVDYTTIEFKMKHGQYKDLISIVKRTNSRVRIVKKEGLNFVFHKLERRKFFALGIVIFIGLILYLSSLVWRIEISGNKKISTEVIYKVLKSSGLTEGKMKYRINLRDVEINVLKNMNNVSVVNIKFLGTKAMVEVVERTLPPKMIPDDKPANIVAAKDGIVTKILSYRGQTMVSAGDYIKEGQVLISGVITDNMNVPSKIVHAKGRVIAKTWYEAMEDIPLNYRYEIRTGKFISHVYYTIMGKRFFIKKDTINFKKYDKIEEKTMVKVFGQESPIEKTIEYYYEKVDNYKKLDYNQAVDLAIKNAELKLEKVLPKEVKVLDKQIDKKLNDGMASVRVLYVIEEEIGMEMEIK